MEKGYSIPLQRSEQELVYKTVGEKQIKMSFLPPTGKISDKAPVYLIIPGGGWCSAVKENMIAFSQVSCDRLREQGFAVCSIEYRIYPAAGLTMDKIVSDVMDAARYLSHFSETLGVDPHRILASGHSAGGHLALMLALAPQKAFTEDSPFDPLADDFTVIGSMPLSPPTQLYPDSCFNLPIAFSAETVVKRETIKEQMCAAHRASPIDYLSPCSVPTLLVYGTHDPLVLPESAHLFAKRAAEIGAPCTVIGSVYGGHCFEPMVEGQVSSPDFLQVQEELVRFACNFL